MSGIAEQRDAAAHRRLKGSISWISMRLVVCGSRAAISFCTGGAQPAK
nr:Uncharacterised protein [Klebsiella pneumoniae]